MELSEKSEYSDCTSGDDNLENAPESVSVVNEEEWNRLIVCLSESWNLKVFVDFGFLDGKTKSFSNLSISSCGDLSS